MPTTSLPRQLARTRRFTLGTPRQVTVSADGGTVFFLRARAGDDPVSCLWAFDVETGSERLLADPLALLGGTAEQLSADERARRERARELSSGVVAYAANSAGDLLAFALSGQLWTVRAATADVRRLGTAEPVVDPRPDPTGQRIAYVSGGALRVVEADGSADRAVAEPDRPDVVFGLAEHVAAESMDRDRGYWWAPDGTRLLAARVDNAAVGRWYVADPADPASPPAVLRYPAAGTANADVTLWLVDLDGSATAVGWDTDGFEYLARAGWDAHGPWAAVQNRSQRHVRTIGIDSATGAVEVLADQYDDAWVTLVPGLPARTAAGVWVTSADADDTRRLVVGGQPVTPPGLQLAAVLAVDGESVLFTASDEPTELHLWSYDAQSGPRRLSDEAGVHGGAQRGGTTVVASRTADRSGTRTAVRRNGRAAAITSYAEQPVLTLRMELLTLGPSQLRAALFLPSWHGAGDDPLPVLMDPYGGPAANKVTAEQSHSALVSQWFAEQGFAVLVVDGRGTAGRGPRWERAVHLDVAGPVLADQVAGLAAAGALRPELDLTRVGVRGWSFGGFLAALAVIRRPDVFHAAVAGAPVTDPRLYDTHWKERHLGHPDAQPDAYDRCSPVLEAGALTRPLLLVHGLADDNVVAAHTLRMSAALLAAGRPHEVLLLPRTTHLPSDVAVAENVLVHQLDFLRRGLGLPAPPVR